MWFSSYRADTICDRQTDGRPGKNNMSPDPICLPTLKGGDIINVKLWYLYLVQHMLHQIKAPQFYTDLGIQKTVLNPFANGKMFSHVVKFKDFFKVLSVFKVLQGKFYFQRLFKTVLYIQVLFKPLRTLLTKGLDMDYTLLTKGLEKGYALLTKGLNKG